MVQDKIKRFTDLEVWHKSHRLALDIYKYTEGFPVDERFGLVSQMRRAAVSIPSNIAEGFGRRWSRDKAHFYTVARSSAGELHYQIILSRELGFLKDTDALLWEVQGISMMLAKLISSIDKN